MQEIIMSQTDIFLLGGKDLEMQEISTLLSQQKMTFFDLSLRWDNALLSKYTDIISCYSHNSSRIFGIELKTDITPPTNYFAIDHHNKLNDNPSSLEQVAHLLNIKLTFRQQLIAANDKFYIEGMEALGATKVEIDEIRSADRQAQGVTEEDECLAKYALHNCMQKAGNLIIVKSATSAFSPIYDALYPCEQLLIYTEEEWVYYGKAKEKLMKYFNEEITLNHVFYGGSKSGYIGLAKGFYNFSKIKEMIEHIINITKYV